MGTAEMTPAQIRLAGCAALVAVVAAAGSGYGVARTLYRPTIVVIDSIACGLPPLAAGFGLPLQAIREATGSLPFAVGPVEVPDGGGPISLVFDPSADGQQRAVRLTEDSLHLPIAFGRDGLEPKRITIHCRDGVIGSVRYQGADRASATFAIVTAIAGGPHRDRFDRLGEALPATSATVDQLLRGGVRRPPAAGDPRSPP